MTAAIQITADIAQVPLFTKVGSNEQIKDLQRKTAGAPIPILQVDKDNLVSQFNAISALIARQSVSSEITEQLLGKTAFEQA